MIWLIILVLFIIVFSIDRYYNKKFKASHRKDLEQFGKILDLKIGNTINGKGPFTYVNSSNFIYHFNVSRYSRLETKDKTIVEYKVFYLYEKDFLNSIYKFENNILVSIRDA